MKNYLLSFFITWLIVKSGYTQNKILKFEHLSVEQGLSHQFVMTVMQDRKGFKWFGTGNGLDKYDGYRFINYKFDPWDTTSLTKNQDFMLWEDKDGIIWVGTSEGICKFKPKTEKFTRFDQSPTNPFVFNYAQSFQEDKAGTVWIGTKRGGLNALNKKTDPFTRYRHKMLNSSSLRSDIVSAIMEDRDVDLITRLPLVMYEQRALKI